MAGRPEAVYGTNTTDWEAAAKALNDYLRAKGIVAPFKPYVAKYVENQMKDAARKGAASGSRSIVSLDATGGGENNSGNRRSKLESSVQDRPSTPEDLYAAAQEEDANLPAAKAAAEARAQEILARRNETYNKAIRAGLTEEEQSLYAASVVLSHQLEGSPSIEQLAEFYKASPEEVKKLLGSIVKKMLKVNSAASVDAEVREQLTASSKLPANMKQLTEAAALPPPAPGLEAGPAEPEVMTQGEAINAEIMLQGPSEPLTLELGGREYYRKEDGSWWFKTTAAKGELRANKSKTAELEKMAAGVEKRESAAQEKETSPGFEVVGVIPDQVATEIGLPKAGQLILSPRALRHIETRHGDQLRALGFKNGREFVNFVLRRVDAVYPGSDANSRLFVTRQMTPYGQVVTGLEFKPDLDGYQVVTASPARADFYKNKTPLWERAQSNHSGEGIPGAVSGQSEAGLDLTTVPAGVKPETFLQQGLRI